jgi:hypothetical protein
MGQMSLKRGFTLDCLKFCLSSEAEVTSYLVWSHSGFMCGRSAFQILAKGLINVTEICRGFPHLLQAGKVPDIRLCLLKLYLYRLIGVQKVEAFRISRKSTHEGVKVVSPEHRPSLLTRMIPGSHFC